MNIKQQQHSPLHKTEYIQDKIPLRIINRCANQYRYGRQMDNNIVNLEKHKLINRNDVGNESISNNYVDNKKNASNNGRVSKQNTGKHGQEMYKTRKTQLTHGMNANKKQNRKSHAIKIVTEIKTNTIKAHICDTETNCLIDSGSHITAINDIFLKQLKLKDKILIPSKLNIKTAISDEKYSVTGKITLPIKISNTTVQQTFFVIPQLSKTVILGLDFLNEHKAEINFEKHSLTLPHFDKTEVNVIRANKKFTLQPKFIRIIPIKMDVKFKNKNVMILDKTDMCGMNIVINNCKKKYIKLPFFNTTEQPITFL